MNSQLVKGECPIFNRSDNKMPIPALNSVS